MEQWDPKGPLGNQGVLGPETCGVWVHIYKGLAACRPLAAAIRAYVFSSSRGPSAFRRGGWATISRGHLAPNPRKSGPTSDQNSRKTKNSDERRPRLFSRRPKNMTPLYWKRVPSRFGKHAKKKSAPAAGWGFSTFFF